MSIFKKIGKAVKKVAKEAERVVTRAKDDILPVAAGIATGGASLAVLPLSETGAIARATGGLGSTLANAYGAAGPGGALSGVLGNLGGGSASAEEETVQYVQNQGPVIQQQPSIDAGATSFLDSIMGIIGGMAPQAKSDVANSPQVGSAAPQVVQAPTQGISSNTMLLVGGGLLALATIFAMGKK